MRRTEDDFTAGNAVAAEDGSRTSVKDANLALNEGVATLIARKERQNLPTDIECRGKRDDVVAEINRRVAELSISHTLSAQARDALQSYIGNMSDDFDYCRVVVTDERPELPETSAYQCAFFDGETEQLYVPPNLNQMSYTIHGTRVSASQAPNLNQMFPLMKGSGLMVMFASVKKGDDDHQLGNDAGMTAAPQPLDNSVAAGKDAPAPADVVAAATQPQADGSSNQEMQQTAGNAPHLMEAAPQTETMAVPSGDQSEIATSGAETGPAGQAAASVTLNIAGQPAVQAMIGQESPIITPQPDSAHSAAPPVPQANENPVAGMEKPPGAPPVEVIALQDPADIDTALTQNTAPPDIASQAVAQDIADATLSPSRQDAPSVQAGSPAESAPIDLNAVTAQPDAKPNPPSVDTAKPADLVQSSGQRADPSPQQTTINEVPKASGPIAIQLETPASETASGNEPAVKPASVAEASSAVSPAQPAPPAADAKDTPVITLPDALPVAPAELVQDNIPAHLRAPAETSVTGDPSLPHGPTAVAPNVPLFGKTALLIEPVNHAPVINSDPVVTKSLDGPDRAPPSTPPQYTPTFNENIVPALDRGVQPTVNPGPNPIGFEAPPSPQPVKDHDKQPPTIGPRIAPQPAHDPIPTRNEEKPPIVPERVRPTHDEKIVPIIDKREVPFITDKDRVVIDARDLFNHKANPKPPPGPPRRDPPLAEIIPIKKTPDGTRADLINKDALPPIRRENVIPPVTPPHPDDQQHPERDPHPGPSDPIPVIEAKIPENEPADLEHYVIPEPDLVKTPEDRIFDHKVDDKKPTSGGGGCGEGPCDICPKRSTCPAFNGSASGEARSPDAETSNEEAKKSLRRKKPEPAPMPIAA